MLSVFPIMFLSLFAHALLRLCLGGAFLYLGARHLRKEQKALEVGFRAHWPHLTFFSSWYLGIVEILIGSMLVLGVSTQIAALVAALLSIKMLVLRRTLPHPAIPEPLFYFLALGASLSLFITGAGVFAFDLPL